MPTRINGTVNGRMEKIQKAAMKPQMAVIPVMTK
jgi:hypothetical protein